MIQPSEYPGERPVKSAILMSEAAALRYKQRMKFTVSSPAGVRTHR
jgi:hypothetical protein